MNRLFPSLFATLLLLATAGVVRAASSVEAVMTSRFLVKGEPGMLEIMLPGELMPDAQPVIPSVKNLTILPGRGRQARQGQGRRYDFYLPFTVASYEVGTYTIPPIELSFDGVVQRTSPVEIRIIDDMDLKWSAAEIGGRRIRYSAAFHSLKDEPYVGEKQPIELKLYFPANQQVLDWGIPDFERDGVSAWRFQPQPRLGRANLLGETYLAVSYPSTVSTNRIGPSAIGPSTLRLQLQVASAESFGRAFVQELNLAVPAVTLKSKALPPGAPEGFENAIGNFTLNVTAGETEIREGDPLNLQITVKGSGNLDALKPPKPLDEDGWKLYDASAVERGEERRELTGEVVFRQFMRPLRLQQAVPPFRLVYFDPAKKAYDTLLSDAIPLNVLPSTAAGVLAGPPPALAMPLEEMTDILGVVNPQSGLLSGRLKLPPWIWQLVPALMALGLIIRIAVRKIGPRLKKDPDLIARTREWREVERAPDQAGPFYRTVGHFIERWLGDRQDPLIAEVLAKRDQVCFRQETSDARIDRNERQQVLKQLRNIALPLIALLLALSSQTGFSAEEPGKLFSDGRYEEAAKGWLDSGDYEDLSADTLYNIGNAAYRLGSPGEAALYYRRALERDSAHPEARQNLRFLERKFGSITIQRPDYEHTLARVPLAVWKGLVWGAMWIVVLGILVFPATRPGAGVRVAAITGFVTAPLLALCGALAWHYYPDDARFAPAREQAVIVADNAAVRTDAARTASKVIDAPAGSLCRLITRSGDWAYVAFTNESRGWVPLVDIRTLVPETSAEAPKARPIKASEDNA